MLNKRKNLTIIPAFILSTLYSFLTLCLYTFLLILHTWGSDYNDISAWDPFAYNPYWVIGILSFVSIVYLLFRTVWYTKWFKILLISPFLVTILYLFVVWFVYAPLLESSM